MITKSIAIALLLCIGAKEAIASDSCLDTAKTTDDVVSCGNKLVPSIEGKIQNEFIRLGEKFQNNDEMQTMLRLTKESWDNYRNIQCNFEGAAAAGGQTKGVLPIKGQKAFLGCVLRTLQQMESALSKL